MLVSLEEKILPDSVTVYLTELFRNNREFKKEFYNLRNYYQGKNLIYADDVFLTAADLIQQKVQQKGIKTVINYLHHEYLTAFHDYG